MTTVTTEAAEPPRPMFRVAAVAGALQVLWTIVNWGTLNEWAWSTILFQSGGVAVLGLVLSTARRLRVFGLGVALGIGTGLVLTWSVISASIIVGNYFRG